LALALIRTAEYLLAKNDYQISSEALHQLLNQVKVVKLISKEQHFDIISDLPAEIHLIYRILNIPKPKVFSARSSI
jgi:hypothetical protein